MSTFIAGVDVPIPGLGNTPAAPTLPADKRADEFADYPRDQWGRPLIILLNPDGSPMRDPATDEFVRAPYQRASGAGSAIEFEGGIQSWRLRQTIIGLIERPDLWALAQSVIDPQGSGRTEMDKTVIKPAQEAAGSDLAANLGTAGHAFAEKVDRGITLPPLSGPFAAWVQTYRTLTAGWRWSMAEARLVWDELQLAGRVDRIGRPPGFMIAPDGVIIGPDDEVVVDVKTSSSSRYFGVKFAVQLAVYANGKLYNLETGERIGTGARTDWGLVVHIPTGGTSGALYWVNLTIGAELAALAKQVMRERGRKDLVSAVDSTKVYATLDEAIAAGGRLDPASPEHAAAIEPDAPGPSMLQAGAAAGAWTPEPDEVQPGEVCEIHGEHLGTVDCIDCLEEYKAHPNAPQWAGGPGMSFETWHGIRLGALALERKLEAARQDQSESPFEPHPTAGQNPADPANIAPDLATRLQAQGDPVRRLELELSAIATAPPRGGLGAVRERFAARWTDQHEAAAQLREWELGVIAALEASTTVDNLTAIANMCTEWGRWTNEMRRVARWCADRIAAKGESS